MKTGIGNLRAKTEDTNESDIMFGDVMSAGDVLSATIGDEEARDTVMVMAELIREHGFNEVIETMYGDELRENGIDTDAEQDVICDNILALIDADVNTESLEVIIIVGLYVLMLAVIVEGAAHYITNLKLLSGKVGLSKIDDSEWDDELATKEMAGVSYKDAIDMYTNAIGIISWLNDFKPETDLKLADIQKRASSINGYVKEKGLTGGKVILKDYVIKAQSLKALGWSSKAVKSFAVEIAKSDNTIGQAMANIATQKKIQAAQDKDKTKMLALKTKIKNYNERKLNTKALRSLVIGAANRIRLAGGTWLNVVKMSPAARLEIKRTK